ncbi:MAG: 16S rRNA (cytosine(1402)-N(4))-methyltransferase RsmH [Chloroflexia bacterium]|nr:16S rRNA (cytosine(1402)-N(4))-methyltransferase RsmH [Chloroflexia bacterium]
MTCSDRAAHANANIDDPGGHLPVMPGEAIAGLDLKPGVTVVDGTFGGGGHSRLIAERIQPGGTLIAIDRDIDADARFEALAGRYRALGAFFQGSYSDMTGFATSLNLERVDGILLDLGFSSLQMDDPARGFSFQLDGPLDMRFDRDGSRSASSLVNEAEESDLADIFYQYGEERQSRRIARAIVRVRQNTPIETTHQLANIVEKSLGGRRGARVHPATRVFQALRIAVNTELDELALGLRAGVELLGPGGRFVVISFHSLEDRIVKRFFAAEARGCVCPPQVPICVCGREPRLRLIGRAVKPSPSEVAANPRSRSAVLRVAERLA